MGTIRKTTRSAQKKQSLKQNYTFKEIGTKILRTVMTVGFAMSSFMAQDVEAAGNDIVRVDGTTNLMQNGVANIYAEQVSGQVGLNRFEHFEVGSNQTANLYFNQAGSTNYVNTLVNTVQNRIDIGGTVNAIRNNKISGNLYFLSPQGMVIGAGGVVNAGSLTVLTPTDDAFDQFKTVETLNFLDSETGLRKNEVIPINASGTIEVHGTINAATAVELQAGKIDVSKATNSSINPVIKTGVVFDEIVNNNISGSITNQKLQAQVDDKGNVTFTDGVVTGDGGVKLIATADKINDNSNKQVVASVNVGQGATVEAVGDIDIKANASHNITITSSTTSVPSHTANTKAMVTIDGNVKGKNVDVQANATSTFSATGLNGIEQFIGGTTEIIDSIANMKPNKIGNSLKDKTNTISQNITSDLFKQANFSYGGADAEAIITINEHADIQAVGVNNNNNNALIGGNVNVNAGSYTLTNIKGALIPKKSNTNGSTSNIDNPYLTLGIVYQENNSNSRVNVKGKIVSYNNLYIGSEAKSENDLALAIKKGGNLTADDAYIKAVIGILNQNANAEVNVGVADNATSGNLLQATGDLNIKSDTQKKINSTVGIQSDLDSMLNTAINIVGGDVSSKVNINDAIQGENVNVTANHLSNGLKIITNNAFDETDNEFVDINNTGAKTDAISNNIKKVKKFVQSLKNKKNNSSNASGNWDQYFDLGASITIDDIANDVEVNVNPDAKVVAKGANGTNNTAALNINAAVRIADKQIKTISILGNNKATSALGVGAAVVIDNLTNNVEVNIISDEEKPQLISEAGNVVIASKIDDGYKRFDNMGFTQKIDPTNYPNVYVYSGVAKDIKDVVVATGTVGIQNINNNSNVNVEAGTVIRANNKVDISATSIVGNALGAGKVGLPSDYNSNGIGGTVAVQNTNINSKVTIANDVEITGGQIDVNANNDVMNVGVVISGTKTSSLGITGMVSYMGGVSNAEVAVDDDAELTATKEVTQVESNYVVSKSGQININSENDTTLTNVVGDVTSSGSIGLGASVGVISYDVHSLAQVKNIETVDTSGKGTFSANSFTTEALTDGTINNITVAGTSVGGSKKENSGSNVNVRDNNNNQAGSTNNTTNLQNATVSSNGVSNDTSSSGRAQNNSSIKIGGAGSVSWNDVHNKTIATVDGVNINLTAPENAIDKTTSLKVQAVDQSYIGAYSGAMALTKAGNNNNTSFSATLSGAVAVNDLVKETSATISGSSISNALNIDNIAQNQGAQVAAGLALGLETGNRTNSIGANISANGSFNYIDSNVNAVMDSVTIAGNTNNINVDNIAYDKDVQVAGGITAEYAKSNIAAGASIAVNKATNDINAIIRNSNIGASNSAVNAVNNLAVSKLTQVGSAVSVGFTASEQNLGVLEAAVVVNNVSNNMNATMEDSNVNAKTVDNKAFDGEFTTGITSSTYLQELAAQGFDVSGADALANANVNSIYSSSQTITANNGNLIVGAALGLGVKLANGSYSGTGGAGVVINNVNNDFISKVSGGSLDSFNLNVEAIADTKMIGVATGIAAASGSTLTIAGSEVSQTIQNDTKALIEGVAITATNMSVEAESNSNLVSVAGQVSAGTGVATAVGGAVSIVNNDSDTSAAINNATIEAQDVIVKAISNNESLNVAIGLSVAASDKTSVGGAGNVVKNNIANDTTVTISGTTIDASGTVAALANGNEVLRNYGGAASVSANSGGASVALGGTVVLNTISGNTNAIVQDSNIVALGAGSGVVVQDYTISKDDPTSRGSNSSTTNSVEGADVAEEMLRDKGTHTVTGSNITKTGFVVNANANHILRDISVTAGIAASTGGGGVALDATVALNTINGKTSAEVNNTNVNNISGLAQLAETADIFVNAYDKVDMQSHIGTLSVGASSGLGVGAATAVDVNKINRETTAKILGIAGTDLNKNIVNGYNIDVNALGETDITITESGLAVGAAATAGGALTGSVSVNHFTGQTNAVANGIVSNAHQFNIEANRVADIQTYNNGAAVSGGEAAVAVGVGVTYVKDESSANASLYDSNVERIGSIDDSEISVQANNKSSISTEAGSGALAIGLGGAVGTSVGVANMNNRTVVAIYDTVIGKNNAFNNVDVQANNLLSSNFTNWAAGGGLAGIGVGVGVNTVNAGSRVNINNSEIYAKDILVSSIETRNIKEVAVGATVGAVGIGVNILNTNIGTAFAKSYDYNVDSTNNKDKTYSTEGIVKAVNGALNKATDTIKVLQDKTNTSNVPDNSIKRMDRGSTDGGVQTAIQNSILHASNELEVFNKATTNADIFVFQGSVGIAGVNVSVGVADVESDLGITLNNANLKGKVIEIYSENDGNIKADTYQASVGAVDVNVGYGSVTNGGNNQITIDGSTIEAVGSTNSDTDDLSICAVNAVDVENIVRGFDVSAAGIDTIISKAIDTSDAKINIGEITGNTFISNEICIEAYNDPHMKAVINNIGGSGLAIRNNIATAKASGKTTLNVDAKNNFNAEEVTLVAISGEDKDEDYGTTQGESTKVTTEAHVSGESPAVVGIMVNKARTYNEMETTVNISFHKTTEEDELGTNKTAETGIANLIIGAVNSTDSLAQLDKNNKIGGGLTSGSNIAQTNANSTVTLSVDAGDKLHVNTLDVYATNNNTIKAIANGSSGSLVNIAPYAAKVENNVTSTTNLNLVGNVETEDYFIAQALGKTVADLKADAMQASVVGGSGTAVDSVITTISNVNIGKKADGSTGQANITTGGDMVVEAENTIKLNRADGFDKMVLGNGYGGVDVSVAHIDNTVNSNANVNLNNTNILSDGEVDLIAHTNEDLRVNGYVYSTGVLNDSNNKVTNKVKNDENIVLNNSKIRLTDASSDLTLSAADDLKLFTYSLSETRFAALGVTTSFVDNNLNRNNKISLTGDSDIFSMQDINLFAGKLVDGNLAKFDLDAEATAFNGSIIPIPINPKVSNDIKQSNVVVIGSNSESTSVRHTNIYADKGLEISRVGAGAYNNYTSSQKTDIVTSLAGEVIKGKTANNYVKIDGKAVAGVASNIKITIGEADEIVILNSDERDLVSGAQAKPTIKIEADESVGLTAESLKLGTEDYANALFNRYLELQALMSEYAKDGTDSKSYRGYSAEADRIADMMVNMGLAVKDTTTNELKMQNSLSVDYIEIPDIEASGGNITVDTSDLYGSGTVQAKGTSVVSITNNTNLLLKVNSIVIDEAGGKLVYNGNILDSATNDEASVTDTLKNHINAINSNVKNVGFDKVTAETNSEIGINIKGTHNGNIQYSYIVGEGESSQTIIHNVKPLANIQIQGDIINREGNVTISSANNDIVIQGQTINDSVVISGTSVSLSASKGSIAQGYTDGIVNIGGSVRDEYENQSSTSSTINTPGSYIAGGSVYINAADINVNGIIQSGYADYNVTIGEDVQNRITAIENNYDGTREISDSTVTVGDSYKIVEGGAYWNATTGCYEYRLNAYYNPATKKIIMEDVDASGGKVYLTGRISSTGNGQIICLDGVSDVTINNSLNYDMKLGEVLVNDVDGLVSIKDYAKNTLTEISKGLVTVNTINTNGAISNSGTITSFEGNYNYDPLANLRYEWTTGTDTTTYTRYSYDEVKALWGLWKPSATTEQLAQWSVENNKVDSGTKSDVPRKEGEVIVIGSSNNDKSYDKTISNKTYSSASTKESERYWSTGFLGFNKHHEVIWTQSSGTVTTVHHSVKADNPINVKFIGNTADSSQITVNTAGNLELTGNVGNTKLYDIDTVGNTSKNYLGNIDITAQSGSIIQTGGNLIGGNIKLAAGEDIRDVDILAGDVVNVSAVNLMSAATDNVHLHSIGLNIKQAHGTKGNVVLGDVGSFRIDGSGNYSTGVTANINITAVGDISQNADKVVAANRIDLATKGSITDLNVYAGQQPIGLDTLDASVNATAEGDIKIKQVDGDMRIGRIYSKSGDVTITVADGSIIDALPYVSQDRGEIDEMLARWESLGIIESDNGTDASGLMDVKSNIDNENYEAWDKNALLYAIEDSIVNPKSDQLHTTSSKDPNIIGHNITLNVKDSAGFFGDGSKEVNITTLFDKKADGTYVNGNALEDLMELSKADASTVSWKTNSSGDKIAVINQVLPVGVQQTVKEIVDGDVTETIHGKLVVESTDSYDSDGFGDIFLEGRNEKDVDNLFINSGNVTNDLFVGQLITQTGDVHLSSLGNIVNSADAGQVAIQANNLIVSAANGSIGTVDNKLTIKLDGFQGTLSGGTNTIKEGTLSAVASGGIYVDQKFNDLAIKNISSGGDIDLSADKSIFMETVNGTDAVNYIRAENNGNITLVAHDGSLGKSSAGGRNTNDGIRILNDSGFATSSNDENVTIVTLKASDDIYVTGVASSDGKTVAEEGPAGVLNLVIANKEKDADNVGISVNGKLNLLSDLDCNENASIYTTYNLDFDGNIDAKDVYISSGMDLNIINGANIFGSDNVTLAVEKEGYDITIKGGNVGTNKDSVSKNLVVYSANDVNLEGGNIIAENAEVTAVNDIIFNSGNLLAETATLNANQDIILADGSLNAVNANLIATNGSLNQVLSADGAGHEIDATSLIVKAGEGVSLGSNENKLSNVYLDVSGGGILIGNGNTGNDALKVSIKSEVDTLTNDITIHNYNNKVSGETGNDIYVEGLLKTNGNITITNDESDIEVLTQNGVVQGKEVTFNVMGDVLNYNEIVAEDQVLINGKNISNAGSITTTRGIVDLNATNNITNVGSITGSTQVDVNAANELHLENGTVTGITHVIMHAGNNAMFKGTSITGALVDITSSGNVSMNAGSINSADGTVNIIATDDIVLEDGSLIANNANLIATNGTLNQVLNADSAGHEIDVTNLTVKAGEGVSLGSNENKLENVYIDVSGGGILIGNGNTGNDALKVSIKSGVDTLTNDITIHNYNNKVNGETGNDIHVEGVLKTTGNITITNDESDIEVLTQNGVVQGKEVTFNVMGDVLNYNEIVAEDQVLINGKNISNAGSITTTRGIVDLNATNNITNVGSITGSTQVDVNAANELHLENGTVTGITHVIMHAGNNAMFKGTSITGALVDITSSGNVSMNAGSINSADGTVNIIATDDIVLEDGSLIANNANLIATNGSLNQVLNAAGAGHEIDVTHLIVKAGEGVSLGSNENKLENVYLDVSGGGILIGNGNTGNDALKVSIKSGVDTLTNDITIHNYNNKVSGEYGNDIHIEGWLKTSGDITLINDEGDVEVLSNDSIAANNVTIEAAGNIENHNVIIANQNVTFNSQASITNNGDIVILEKGNVLLKAGNDIHNTDDLYTVEGDIIIEANGNIVNGDGNGKGIIETEFGDVTVTSLNGSINNLAKADLISGNGNVTLDAKGESNNASVENHGDLMALGGTITLKSAHGNVINTDDFSTLSDSSGNVSEDYIGIYDADNAGVDIATGNILLSAENGTLSNNKNLESAENITLIAGDGLDDFAFNIFAGKNITLTATSGDVVNTSVLESYAGDIKLIAEIGNVNNGVSGDNATGDIISLGGSVTMEAQGNVNNYGDIIAIGDTVNDNAGSGSITLKSHYGNVNNYDDFNVVGGYETYGYDDANHGSITSSDSSFNIATSNIILSAVNGTIYNYKDYLVALGDIALEAREGVGNYGELLMAGGNITLSDTDGNLINAAKLISIDGDITLNASNGTVVNMLAGDVFALNGNVTFNAKGDVTNYGDVIALNSANQNNKGSISFVSSDGNVTNYDDFKLIDGNGYYDYDGTEGFAKFNEGTPYHFEKRYILTDSDLTMKALKGSIFNNMELNSKKDITLVSGNDLVIGTNVANVISNGDVIVQSLNGNVKLQQGSEVLSHDGNIVLDGNQGVDVVDGSALEATSGSISVVSTNGAVNVAKMIAKEMANIGSNSNNVVVGEVQGKKVVLFSQGADAKIDAQNIKVQDYLVLQGDNVVLDKIDRSNNKGILNVDVSGVNGGTMKGKLSMDLEGDVRFTTANVTNTEVRVGGKLGLDKVHVDGKGHFYSQGYVTGIYGIAPNHDGSNALYFDFGRGYGPTVSTMLGLSAASFTTDNALNAMNSINYDLDAFAQSGDTFNKHNNGWMNLYVDGSRVQRSNGALLRIDTHYNSYNQRWSAEDIASKQNDFRANHAYDYHFEDRPVLFNRNNLYDIPETVIVPVTDEQVDGKANGRRKRVLSFEGDKV